MIVIFDIDGTIADNSHRRHFVEDDSYRSSVDNSDWESFLHPDNVINDKPIQDMIKLGRLLYNSNHRIHIITSRQESLRETTISWLHTHGFNFYSKLLMRKDHDHRPDYIIKEELVRAMYSDPTNILLAIDDSDTVIDMYRDLSIPVLKV